jgi:outer membrane protein
MRVLKYKSSPWLPGVAACAVAFSASADDLLSTYHEARSADPVYAEAHAAHEAQVEALPQGRAGLLPSLILSADTQINDRDISFRGPPIPGFGANGSQRYNSNEFGVTLTQPLFRYRNWVSFEQAKRNFEVGTATITDAEDAQARFDLNVAQEIGAQNNLEIKHEALQQLIGHAPPALAPISPDIPLDRPAPDDMNAWVSRTQDASLQVQIVQAAVEIADREVAKNRAGHLPTVDAVAAYTDSAEGAGPFGGAGIDTNNKYIGLQLALPLFEGGTRKFAGAAGRCQSRQGQTGARKCAAHRGVQYAAGVLRCRQRNCPSQSAARRCDLEPDLA